MRSPLQVQYVNFEVRMPNRVGEVFSPLLAARPARRFSGKLPFAGLRIKEPPQKYNLLWRQKSFAEQIAVCSCTGQRQYQHIILNPINEKPVRLDMTFPVPHPIAGQLVVSVFLRQGFTP